MLVEILNFQGAKPILGTESFSQLTAAGLTCVILALTTMLTLQGVTIKTPLIVETGDFERFAKGS